MNTLNHNILRAGIPLITGMLAYNYAKKRKKDALPYFMIGSFVGNVTFELLTNKYNHDKL